VKSLRKISIRVAARFAAQAPGARKETRDKVFPINSQKGISKDVIKGNAVTESKREDQVDINRKDIQPADVFNANANNVVMLNFTQKGWPGVADDYQDMEKAIRKQIPKDKGYDTVKNLSQYLIETRGGGGTKPAGR
jgi:hypothetical protein